MVINFIQQASDLQFLDDIKANFLIMVCFSDVLNWIQIQNFVVKVSSEDW